jgi:hypothetical protein
MNIFGSLQMMTITMVVSKDRNGEVQVKIDKKKLLRTGGMQSVRLAGSSWAVGDSPSPEVGQNPKVLCIGRPS